MKPEKRLSTVFIFLIFFLGVEVKRGVRIVLGGVGIWVNGVGNSNLNR